MTNSTTPTRKIAPEDAAVWVQVGEGQIHVSDIVDQTTSPEAAMTVGYARIAAGETLEISFPYDEVLVITKGCYMIRTPEGIELTASTGQVIYLPGGSSNQARAETDTEMVYVAAPPEVYASHVAASVG